jgi:hypothetical protein
MPDFQVMYEEFKVQGKDLVEKIKALVHEGNIRRIIIKDEKGNTFLEIPLTVAAVGIIVAPVLAAVGAIAALVSDFTIVVEKLEDRSIVGGAGTKTPGDSEEKEL